MEPERQFSEHKVETASAGERLDVFLARASGESRARVQQLIAEGNVLVNNEPARANKKLKLADCVTMWQDEPKPLDVLPENIPLDIVYQDSDICVINKPQGMVVHPAPGNESGTLVNALMYALNDLSGIGGVMRPGIVHRIDKETSGMLVVAKNDYSHASLSEQISAHTAKRKYLAIVEGNIKEDKGFVDAPIGRHPVDRKKMAVRLEGREAQTHWSVLERMGNFTLIEAQLETGRTHQIRVHMRHIKHPVVGDPVYGAKTPKLGLEGQALHAYSLQLKHPRTGESKRFYAPPPESFIKALLKAGWSGEAMWERE